jgi:hypothetical protein
MQEVVFVGINFGVNYLLDNPLHGKAIINMGSTVCYCLARRAPTSIAFRNNPIAWQSNVSARRFPCLPNFLTLALGARIAFSPPETESDHSLR